MKWKTVEVKKVEKEGKIGILYEADVKKATGELFGCAQRIYWIDNNTRDTAFRGGHYHPSGGKQEFLLCLSGKAEIEIHASKEQGGCNEKIVLDNPAKAIVIPSNVWHGVKISSYGILLAIASTSYKEGESVEELESCACGKFGGK